MKWVIGGEQRILRRVANLMVQLALLRNHFGCTLHQPRTSAVRRIYDIDQYGWWSPGAH